MRNPIRKKSSLPVRTVVNQKREIQLIYDPQKVHDNLKQQTIQKTKPVSEGH